MNILVSCPPRGNLNMQGRITPHRPRAVFYANVGPRRKLGGGRGSISIQRLKRLLSQCQPIIPTPCKSHTLPLLAQPISNAGRSTKRSRNAPEIYGLSPGNPTIAMWRYGSKPSSACFRSQKVRVERILDPSRRLNRRRKNQALRQGNDQDSKDN